MFLPNKNRGFGGIPTDPKQPAKPMSRAMKRRLWVTVVLTFALMFIWFGCIALGERTHDPAPAYVVMIAYFSVFGVLLVTYLAYNRGFVNRDVTVDMLPEDWSEERKQAFVDGNRRRAEKSRWMVTLIIPFVVVFMVETLYLFVWDGFLSEFFKG